MKQICEACGASIPPCATAFRLRIELYADPDPPEITDADMQRDFKSEMQRLIEQMERQGVEEAEDEVHESYLFTLCASCRRRTHRWLRGLPHPLAEDS